MRRFHFKLEGFIKIKTNAEEKALAEYAKTMQQRNQVELRLDELHQFFSDTRDNQLVSRKGTMSAWHYGADMAGLQSIASEIKETENALAAALESERRARAAFLTAKAERESVERLKAKKEEEFYREMQRAEELELEEVALLRYARPDALST